MLVNLLIGLGLLVCLSFIGSVRSANHYGYRRNPLCTYLWIGSLIFVGLNLMSESLISVLCDNFYILFIIGLFLLSSQYGPTGYKGLDEIKRKQHLKKNDSKFLFWILLLVFTLLSIIFIKTFNMHYIAEKDFFWLILSILLLVGVNDRNQKIKTIYRELISISHCSIHNLEKINEGITKEEAIYILGTPQKEENDCLIYKDTEIQQFPSTFNPFHCDYTIKNIILIKLFFRDNKLSNVEMLTF